MNLETKITIYKFTPQVFTLTPNDVHASFVYIRYLDAYYHNKQS